MRTLITTILLLALGVSANALTIIHGPVAHSSFLISDDLVYGSNGAATSAGWNISSVSFNSTTSPAPLLGFASSLQATWATSAYRTFTASSDVWIYIPFNVATIGGNTDVVSILDASGNGLARIYRKTDGSLWIYHGSASANTTALSTGTTGHYWLHYVASNSSNGVLVLHRSTDGTKGSALLTISSGTSTASAARVTLGSSGNATIYFNKLRVSNTSIGDNGT